MASAVKVPVTGNGPEAVKSSLTSTTPRRDAARAICRELADESIRRLRWDPRQKHRKHTVRVKLLGKEANVVASCTVKLPLAVALPSVSVISPAVVEVMTMLSPIVSPAESTRLKVPLPFVPIDVGAAGDRYALQRRERCRC